MCFLSFFHCVCIVFYIFLCFAIRLCVCTLLNQCLCPSFLLSRCFSLLLYISITHPLPTSPSRLPSVKYTHCLHKLPSSTRLPTQTVSPTLSCRGSLPKSRPHKGTGEVGGPQTSQQCALEGDRRREAWRMCVGSSSICWAGFGEQLLRAEDYGLRCCLL